MVIRKHLDSEVVNLGAEERRRANEIIRQFREEPKPLIPILQGIQKEFGYLPRPVLFYLSRYLQIPMSRIWGIVTFYSQFNLEPSGEHTIKVCQGTACHVQGGKAILESIKRQLDIVPGETTEDGTFSLKRVACVGCCALAPVVEVDGEVHGNMTVTSVKDLLTRLDKSEGG